jgi:putative PIN family toxin of toxin-antitoxin system
MRYLLDTCIIISALRSKRGASFVLLKEALLGNLPIVMHFKLLAEYRDVLMRQLEQQALVFDENEIEEILSGLCAVATESKVRFLWRPNLKDEGDNFIVEIAFAFQPCTIITHNVRDFRNGELYFPEVLVKTPQQVLQGRK